MHKIFTQIMEQSKPNFWGLQLKDAIYVLCIVAGFAFGYGILNGRIDNIEKKQVEAEQQRKDMQSEMIRMNKDNREEYIMRLNEINRSIELLRQDIKELWRK